MLPNSLQLGNGPLRRDPQPTLLLRIGAAVIAAVQVDAHSGQVLSKLVQNPADRAEESGGGKKQTK